jgi:hypothetical protein
MPKRKISERLVCNHCGRSMKRTLSDGSELRICIECELGLQLEPFDPNKAMDLRFGWWETCESCRFPMMWVVSVYTKYCDNCMANLLRFVEGDFQ